MSRVISVFDLTADIYIRKSQCPLSSWFMTTALPALHVSKLIKLYGPFPHLQPSSCVHSSGFDASSQTWVVYSDLTANWIPRSCRQTTWCNTWWKDVGEEYRICCLVHWEVHLAYKDLLEILDHLDFRSLMCGINFHEIGNLKSRIVFRRNP